MAGKAIRRPGSVTLLVILVWINAILTLIAGLTLVLAAANANVANEFEGGADAARLAGWFLIIVGLIIALIAIGLAAGSNFLRILITVIIVLRIIGDVFLVVRSTFDVGALFSVLLSVIILALLWNSRADEFFTQR